MMSRHRSEESEFIRGQKDGAKGRDDPPHQGPVFSKNWWESDMSGRPVVDRSKRGEYDAYRDGQDNARKQKK